MKKILLVLLFLPLVLIGQTNLNKAENLIKNKAFFKAENELIIYLKENPNNLKALELLGDAFGHQKKWDDAIKQYKKLVEEKPNNANYHYKYGGALGMKALAVSKINALGIIGDLKNAFLKAAALDPNHIDARWALVELYMQLPGIVGGSKSKSLKYANELEKLSKIDGFLAKGYIYEYDNEPMLAEKFYKKALAENNTNKETANYNTKFVKYKRNAMHYQIGKVCADYNLQLDKGVFYLNAYLQNYSTKDGVPKAWAYYRLAQIYKHKNNNAEALNWINKAITNLPKIDVFNKFKESLK